MTDEMFEALSQYEGVFDRVKARQYQPYPGLQALQTMLAAVREVRPHYRPNLGCSSCVRTLVLETAGMYYTEKAERASKTPVDATSAPGTDGTPKTKKRAPKSKTNDK